MNRRRILNKKIAIYLCMGILCIAGFIFYFLYTENRPAVLEIYVFNLKTGRSILLRTPSDKRILIDGGGNAEIIRHITDILPFYSRNIDYLISTDLQAKNTNGFLEILDRYKVSKIFVPEITLESLGFATSSGEANNLFEQKALEKNIEITTLKEDSQIEIDPAIAISVLFPANRELFAYSKASSPELILRIQHASVTIDIEGDITPKVEKYLASKMATSSESAKNRSIFIYFSSPQQLSPRLIEKIQPRYLIYSKSLKNSSNQSKTSGKEMAILDFFDAENRFNLKEYKKIRIISDGKELKVETSN